MPEIQKIEDAYIDAVIKANEVYNPNLDVTQGVRLRELIKLMRDRIEQQGENGATKFISADFLPLLPLQVANRDAFEAAVDGLNLAPGTVYKTDQGGIAYIMAYGHTSLTNNSGVPLAVAENDSQGQPTGVSYNLAVDETKVYDNRIFETLTITLPIITNQNRGKTYKLLDQKGNQQNSNHIRPYNFPNQAPVILIVGQQPLFIDAALQITSTVDDAMTTLFVTAMLDDTNDVYVTGVDAQSNPYQTYRLSDCNDFIYSGFEITGGGWSNHVEGEDYSVRIYMINNSDTAKDITVNFNNTFTNVAIDASQNEQDLIVITKQQLMDADGESIVQLSPA